MSEKINFPTKLEEKLSFWDRIRKMMKKTSIAMDSKGNISYISYPPKRGFSDKQKKNIETLEINDVLILGDDRDTSLHELKALKTLVLGRGVVAVADGAIPTTGVEELVLSEQVKQIPMGTISGSSIKRVRGEGFNISTTSKNTVADIYFDQDERLNFVESAHFSFGQLDDMALHGHDPVQKSEAAACSLSKQILKNTSKENNKNSIYIYSDTLGSDRIYSVHAVVDSYPMPSNRGEKLDDEKLIGILVTGTDEVDLGALSRYPNLRQIVVGKDVKRVVKTPDLKETNIIDEDKRVQRTQKSSTGKEQSVTIMSDETILLNSMVQPQTAPTQEKTVERQDEKTIDD